jgi:hypothetical protein
MNEKTIADAELEDEIDLCHQLEMYDREKDPNEKEQMRQWAERNLKAAVLLYLNTKRDDAEALFNLLRGIAQVGGFKEQGMGVIYLNGEFATNFFIPITKQESDGPEMSYCSEVIHISYNTIADEEEIEILKQDNES